MGSRGLRVQGIYLALTKNWWVAYCAVEPVKEAVHDVYRNHWKLKTDELLKNNARDGQFPGTLSELARAIGLNYVDLWRRRTTSGASLEELQALARVLSVDVDFFLVEEEKLVVEACQYLCDNMLAWEDANIYAEYVLRRTPSDAPFPDSDEIEDFIDLGATGPERIEAIVRVAKRLAPQLERAFGRTRM
jgi:transcriptional regulator with XRE-family HTH domain